MTPNLTVSKTVKGLEARPHYKIFKSTYSDISVYYLISALDPKHFWQRSCNFKPNQRPQSIQSVISGRIEKWYVKEGDFKHMSSSEIKEDG
jgi:hypothetical protein